MFNANQFCGTVCNIKYGTKDRTGTPFLDFVLKIKRDEGNIYDLLDCSLYGKKAEHFCKTAKDGDLVLVAGEYRSGKIIADGVIQEKYSHFLINKYRILKN
ncbi:MAG: single-stranded DNA-binding protein [Thomasclavelia ramosa]